MGLNFEDVKEFVCFLFFFLLLWEDSWEAWGTRGQLVPLKPHGTAAAFLSCSLTGSAHVLMLIFIYSRGKNEVVPDWFFFLFFFSSLEDFCAVSVTSLDRGPGPSAESRGCVSKTGCGTCLHVGMLTLEQLPALWFLMNINDAMPEQKKKKKIVQATALLISEEEPHNLHFLWHCHELGTEFSDIAKATATPGQVVTLLKPVGQLFNGLGMRKKERKKN